jgi:hypothetical protein
MAIVGDWFIMSRFGLNEGDERNFRSHRDGASWSTWEPLAYQDDNFYSYAVVGETLFAVRGGSEIHRTDDFGASWSPVTAASESLGWKIFAREGSLLAAEQTTNGGMIFRSDGRDGARSDPPSRTPSVGARRSARSVGGGCRSGLSADASTAAWRAAPAGGPCRPVLSSLSGRR